MQIGKLLKGWRSNIVTGLMGERTYLLVYGLVIAICTTLGVSVRQTTWVMALLIALVFGLGGYAIYLVEKRKMSSLAVDSPQERDSLSVLQRRGKAIRAVFEGLIYGQTPRCIVYSNTPVRQFYDHQGKKIELPFKEEERQVTTIPDAQGIARIHTLLHLEGKMELLRVLTAQDFTSQDWGSNLILIGSPNSNPKTEDALQSFGSPFRFSSDMKRIVAINSTEGPWPKAEQEIGELDYGIIVKFKLTMGSEGPRVYFVLAGIGPTGTLACCHFLYKDIESIHKKFTDSPFAYLVSVNRRVGYISVKEEKSVTLETR